MPTARCEIKGAHPWELCIDTKSLKCQKVGMRLRLKLPKKGTKKLPEDSKNFFMSISGCHAQSCVLYYLRCFSQLLQLTIILYTLYDLPRGLKKLLLKESRKRIKEKNLSCLNNDLCAYKFT